jgi:hypothetical protein
MPADEGRIGSAEKDGIRVDAYVPKDGEAPADAVWVDDQTQKPLLKKGAKVAYVVFAATNVGEAPVYVEWAGWSPSVSAEGWDYFTSLGSLVLPEEDGNYSATAIQDALIPEDPNARVKLEPGESCAVTLLVPHGYANYTFAGPLNIYGAEAAAEPERTVVFEGIELGL